MGIDDIEIYRKIIRGDTVENSVLFKKVFVGNNCVIKNSILLNHTFVR